MTSSPNTPTGGECCEKCAGEMAWRAPGETKYTGSKCVNQSCPCHLPASPSAPFVGSPRGIPTGGEWEKAALINLAKRYATACYLVEEESHDEELRTNALTELIDYVSYLLSSAHADGVKEGLERALEKVDRKSEKYSPARTARHALEELAIELTALTPEEPIQDNYERDHSHFHCWEQGKSPACGMKGEHKRCCLCGILKERTTGKSGL